MFEDKDYGLQLLMDPLRAQADALKIQEERLQGKLRIADANNPFAFLLEFSSSLNNICAMRYEEAFRSLYPLRAQTMDDLYKHMTDYDYVNLFSKPASTTIELYLNRDYLTTNAMDEGTLYKKIVIPKETVFTIGKFKFGLYYPIVIRITKLTGTILTSYDVSQPNPLMAVSSNMVDSSIIDSDITTSDQEFSGLNILALRFPIYQFSRSYVEEQMVSAIGFAKKYTYNDKFYALRVYGIKDGVKTELGQTLSPVIYDPSRPTVKFSVDILRHELKLEIPQIYFTNSQIGGKLGLEVFTCLGELDHDLSSISLDSTAINFNLKDKNVTEYSYILARSVTLAVRVAQSKVTGGSNGYTFEELRDRVVNDNFYGTVPITSSDVEKYFADDGFTVRRTYEGVTERVFTAYRALTDDAGSIIPSAMATVPLSNRLVEDISTIVKGYDSSVTLLPTTLYKYSVEESVAIPLTDTERQVFKSFDRYMLADELNKNMYTVSPLHLRLDTADKYPAAISYNLRVPEIVRFDFIGENIKVPTMMTGFAYSILHLNEGVGGYEIYMSVTKSSDIANLDESNFLVWIHTTTREGSSPGIAATFVEKKGQYHIYKVNIETSYRIDDQHRLQFTNFSIDGFSSHFIDLDNIYHVTFMINRNAMPTASQAGYEVINGIPSSIISNFIGISRQHLHVHLGHRVDDVMRNSINIVYQPVDYVRHPVDVPLTYLEDVYATNEDGTIVTDIDGDNLKTYIVHNEGDVVKDDNDEVVMKHEAGDIMFDAYGQPIISREREIVYHTQMIHIDARAIFSEHPDQINLSKTLPATLENYFATTREKATQMLEQTKLLFSPAKTLGMTSYNVGDGVTSRGSLSLSFKATYYVPAFVMNDSAIQTAIYNATVTEIEVSLATKVISLTAIFDRIQTKLSDYIYQVDIGGVNGDPLLQSFTISEDAAHPTISKKLVVSSDNTLMLMKDVEIKYKAYGI